MEKQILLLFFYLFNFAYTLQLIASNTFQFCNYTSHSKYLSNNNESLKNQTIVINQINVTIDPRTFNSTLLYTMKLDEMDEFAFTPRAMSQRIIEEVLRRLKTSVVNNNSSPYYQHSRNHQKRSVPTSDHLPSTSSLLSLLPSNSVSSPYASKNLDFVRVKLQGIIFDVKFQRSDYKSNDGMHLRNLMKPYPHLLLDPHYTEQVITAYNPLVMQNQICKEFEQYQSGHYVANSFFIVNDIGALVDRPMHDRLHRLFFQIASALGIPSITWLPNRVGQFELDDSQLAIRLEPLTWHVARALVDFMQAYKWNLVIMVYNTLVPGSDVLVEEFRKLQVERSAQDHPNFFEFEINYQFPFEGLTSIEFTECINQMLREIRPCLIPLVDILESIWRADARVIIFNGNFFDLNTLLYIADSLNGTKHEHLKALFGEDYVWIYTPSTMSSLTVADNQDKVSSDNNVLAESTMFKKIPGMFGLICLNDHSSRKRSAEIAREVWQKSMIELIYQLTQIYPPDRSIQIDTPNEDTLIYFKQILEKLRPIKLCQNSDHLSWQWGRRMYDIMHSVVVNVDNEPISFLPNGGLNVSKLFVYNSRITDGRMKWYKVGTWSMSSKLGRTKSRLRIDGVTWPGGSNSPPKGRPSKFKLRVVTIKEIPFVIYNKAQEGGTCDANSIPCKLRPQSLQDEDISGKNSIVDKSLSSLGMNSYNKDFNGKVTSEMLTRNFTTMSELNSSLVYNSSFVYVDGCCSGLTMDLLMELMKDLNFDVEMYEVMDGYWGAWTPDGWNGIIRDLMDNRADMAVTSLKITPNRSQQIEFSVPFLETGIAVAVALREGAIAPTAFLKPYDYQCWCVILVFSVHATGAALYIYEWFSPNGMNRGHSKDQNHRFSFFRSLWLIWSMLFGAAVNADNPRGMASRFMANIWALFALVFLASYTANLAAFMIAKEDYFDLSGINDWRLQHPWNVKPPFRFATIPNGATEENIKINFPEMHKYMRKYNKSGVEDGLKAMKSGQLDAFLYDANVLDYWAMKDEGCKLRTVGNLYAMTGYGIGFAKNSRWLTKVNSRILDYQKNGKLQRWKKFWQTGSCKKDAAVGNTNKTLGVKNFISAFILLVCGMLICTVFMSIEYTFYWYAKPKLRKINQNNWFSRHNLIKSNNYTPNISEHNNQIINGKFAKRQCDNPTCDIKSKNYAKQVELLQNQLNELQKSLQEKNLSSKKYTNSKRNHSYNEIITLDSYKHPKRKKRPNYTSHQLSQSYVSENDDINKYQTKKYSMTKPIFNSTTNNNVSNHIKINTYKEGLLKTVVTTEITSTTDNNIDNNSRTTTNTTTKKPNSRLSKDAQNRITIIPIIDHCSKYAENEFRSTKLRDKTDIQYVILPKLDSSPNRRRRFIKSQSINPNYQQHKSIISPTNIHFDTIDNATTTRMDKTQSVVQVVGQNDTFDNSGQNCTSYDYHFIGSRTTNNTNQLTQYSSVTCILNNVDKNLTLANVDYHQRQKQIASCLVEKESVL
ncbi:hypothetical protein MN116_001679 [Schistosoma mekongi]|uniref:Uncharacterized protein n=1 Tax=Schistosoma mekongi TaxID=38744 RepID=A0AAE2D7N3_SCHME|nr:hypothetical protein MN116_001679 [Schistosoma mekongi]